jgi:hypothetical protein
MNSASSAMAALVAGLAVACGAVVPVSTAQVAAVQATIHEAEQGGAPRLPLASIYLEMAKKEVAEAQRLNAQRSHEDALLTLDCARADAELALALAGEAALIAQADRAVETP